MSRVSVLCVDVCVSCEALRLVSPELALFSDSTASSSLSLFSHSSLLISLLLSCCCTTIFPASTPAAAVAVSFSCFEP